MRPISSVVKPTHLDWTQGPVFDSEIKSGSFNGYDNSRFNSCSYLLRSIRVDITIITAGKSFYQLDVHLEIIAKHSLSKFVNSDITCHGFHSGVLVFGSEDGQIHILDLKRQKHNSVSFSRQSVSTLSIDENHIMVGSFCGEIGLYDRRGGKIFEYAAKGDSYIHSVSIYDDKVLAADAKTVYLWEIKNLLPSSLTIVALRSKYVLWACLNSSDNNRELCHPTTWTTKRYLVGKTHRPLGKTVFRWCFGLNPPVWERPFRPAIQGNVPMDKRYALKTTASVLKVRNLNNGCFIRNFRFDKGREYILMLWSAQDYVFRVIEPSKVIERATLRIDNENVKPAYFGSIDLRMDDGP